MICQDLFSAQINQKHLLTWSFHLSGSYRDHQEQSSFNREHKMQMSLQIRWLQKHWVYHERFNNKSLHHTQHFIFISFNMFSMLGTAHATKTQGRLSGKRPGKTAHQKLNQGPALFLYLISWNRNKVSLGTVLVACTGWKAYYFISLIGYY